MSRGTPIEVAKYRAKDLTPHDVIQIKVEQTLVWVEVEAVYSGKEGAAALRKISERNRLDYQNKTAPNIGIALFIDGYNENDSGHRLARVEDGLAVVVKSRVLLDSYDNENWREFRSLHLVDVQQVVD